MTQQELKQLVEREGDRKEIHDPKLGLKGIILRMGELGHLCGYVVIPKDHPLHGVHYDDIHLEAHGGLTFSAPLLAFGGEYAIGFDCAHWGDRIPFTASCSPVDEYRDMEYVENEVRRLMQQVAEYSSEVSDA